LILESPLRSLDSRLGTLADDFDFGEAEAEAAAAAAAKAAAVAAKKAADKKKATPKKTAKKAKKFGWGGRANAFGAAAGAAGGGFGGFGGGFGAQAPAAGGWGGAAAPRWGAPKRAVPLLTANAKRDHVAQLKKTGFTHVQGSRGETYTVNTNDATCTCMSFIRHGRVGSNFYLQPLLNGTMCYLFPPQQATY
jgi:hypothetical protein